MSTPPSPTVRRQGLGLLKVLLAFLLLQIGAAGFSGGVFLICCVVAVALSLWASSSAKPPENATTRQKTYSSVVNILALLLIVMTVGLAMHGPMGPELRETRIRSRVSRARTDMRHIDAALTAYRTAHAAYPRQLLPALTTPVAYLDAPLYDPFPDKPNRPYFYQAADGAYVLGSVGPDGVAEVDASLIQSAASNEELQLRLSGVLFDPTNGIESRGDVLRWHVETTASSTPH